MSDRSFRRREPTGPHPDPMTDALADAFRRGAEAGREALLALADRVEREEHSALLWYECFYEVAELEPRLTRVNEMMEFKSLMDVGAYRDAAAMLMPEGWVVLDMKQSHSEHFHVVLVQAPIEATDYREGEARGPHAEARARCAAALRARTVIGGET